MKLSWNFLYHPEASNCQRRFFVLEAYGTATFEHSAVVVHHPFRGVASEVENWRRFAVFRHIAGAYGQKKGFYPSQGGQKDMQRGKIV